MSLFRTKPIYRTGLPGRPRLSPGFTELDLIGLGLGAVIGTGLFVITGIVAAKHAGPGVVLSLLLAGVVAALTAMNYAELATMIPSPGGAYTYSYVALGELPAWLIGWDLVLEYTVAAGAVAIGWSAYITGLLAGAGLELPRAISAPPAEGGIVNVPAVLVVAAVTGLLARGTRATARFALIMMAIKLAVVVGFVLIGAPAVDPANWIPFAPFGIRGVLRGAAIVFFAFIGFDVISKAAEEVKRPARDLAPAIMLSLGIAIVLYIAVALVMTGLVRFDRLDTADPMARALLLAGRPRGAGLVAAGAILGLTSVLLVDIYGQTRVFFSMSRDGLLPAWFCRVDPRRGTPSEVTVITGVMVALISGLLPVSTVAELANIGTLAAFMMVSIAVIVLRFTRPGLPRPFRVPGMPWLPLGSALACLYLMASLPARTWIRFAVWLLVGLGIYLAYGRRNSNLN